MATKKPNFIVILTDDQGYGDLSCMGGTDFRTPYIDELAESGIRFTDWYSGSPVCSPSRACLLTGRYPGNAGVRSILAGHRKASGLTAQAPTMAAALKKQGYQTALVGKWHLGLKEGSRPNDNGFDYFYGFMAGCIDYYSHVFYWGMADGHTNPSHDLWENREEVYQNGEYMTDLITRKAVERIRVMKDQPFFLYIAYNAPHYPLHAPDKYVDRFRNIPSWDRRMMAAMISAVDDGVGDVIHELKRDGIYENTAVFFQSDNGPSRESRNWMDGRTDLYYGGTSGGLKGHKFSLFEGGIRVPGILSWPELVPSGKVLSTPCFAGDIFPTFLSAAGDDLSGYELDGTNLLPLLYGEEGAAEKLQDRELYWEMDTQTAMRKGNMKLVLNGMLEENKGQREPVFLSDLSTDRGETHNLAALQPETVRQMSEKALTWRAGIEQRWKDQWAANYENLTL